MRVICLVPSLTETLIEYGVNVVGRSRFCIHPEDKVKGIAKVGGTKDINWDKCHLLAPDLVVFDREENLKSMAEECPFPWVATHITSVDNISEELEKLALVVDCRELSVLAQQWQVLSQISDCSLVDWANIPGQIVGLRNELKQYKRIEYIIWRDPWMAISQQTFIASILQKLGFAPYLRRGDKPYPILSEAELSDPETFYLFSSEPFPFARHRQSLLDAGLNGAIVDGELFSWFGVRSYNALIKHLT